jgi:hypothetical protein
VNRSKLVMMHCIVALAAALVMAAPATVRAGDVTTVVGSVTFVSKDAVEIDGRRGLITSATSVNSDGHPVSPLSIQVGMPAEMEMDPAGNALEVRVKGAVE